MLSEGKGRNPGSAHAVGEVRVAQILSGQKVRRKIKASRTRCSGRCGSPPPELPTSGM